LSLISLRTFENSANMKFFLVTNLLFSCMFDFRLDLCRKRIIAYFC
jgi:hypothetical protein